MTTPRRDIGELLREVHRHAWRADAPPLDLPLADVVTLMPNLVRSGSVGLVWPRLRARAEEYGAVGEALQAAYQSQADHNALVEREIVRVVARLHAAGIRPVLIKGWAVARLYPPGLVRTTGDIDLVVPDRDYAAAQEALSDIHLSFHRDKAATRRQTGAVKEKSPVDVDLHSFTKWGEGAGEDFFVDAHAICLDGIEVHVPRVEDHLRALCLHFLRHAAVRPLRLCDIAVLLDGLPEARPVGFEWDRLLGESGEQSKTIMIMVTLRLAQELLGADLDGAPEVVRERPLPSWLVPAVLRQWEENPTVPGAALSEVLSDPGGIVRTFTRRWPDPITATLRTGTPFNSFPRGPIALAAYLKQIGSYALKTLPEQAGKRRKR